MTRKKAPLFPGEKEDHAGKEDAAPKTAVSSAQEPKTMKKRIRKGLRLLFPVLRVLFLWIPAGIILLVAIVLFAAGLFLTPVRVQSLAVSGFNSMSNAKLSLDVRKFSLYSDILIENIRISNPPGYGGGNFFELKQFHLRYGFFSMLVGQVHFDEIGIYKPRVYLLQKNGVWNASVLMKPSEPKPKEKEKVKEPSGPLPSEINLPWSMRFFLNFVLEDAYVYMKGDNFKAELGGISFRTKIDVPPFRKIPLSLDAVSLLKDVEIVLNPEERIDLSFQSDAAGVQPPLVMGWKLLYHRKSDGPSQFESSMRIGTYRTPVRFKNAHLAPLDVKLLYDIFYDPSRDRLAISDFGVSFKGKRWMKITGNVSGMTKTQNVDIRMSESDIELSDLYPYYLSLTGDDSLRFGGTVSLLPLSIKGTPDDIAVHGGVQMRGIQVKMPEIGFELALPLMELSYGLDMKGSSAQISAGLSMPHFSYKLARSPSGDNGFSFDTKIYAKNNFSRFDLAAVNVRYYSPVTKEDALRLRLGGDVRTAPSLDGTVRIEELYFSKDPLAGMIFSAMKGTIADLPLKKPVTASAKVAFDISGGVTHADAKLGVKVPDYNLNDLSLTADVSQNAAKQRIDIRKVTLSSPSFGLNLSLGGFVEMKKPPLSDSDIKVHLALDYPKKTDLYGPWNLNGGIFLDARMKGDLSTGKASGSLAIKNLSVSNAAPEMMLDVRNINMAFPFEYDFAFRPEGGSKIAVDKAGVIDSIIFREKDNFTIEFLAMKHPARDMQFVMMKDLKGSLFFRKNTFEIQKLSMNVLDGTIYGKDILFYLADMNPANMQFSLALDVTNLDIGRLDDPDPKSKTRDAELSLNAKIYGTGVDVSQGMTGINGTIGISKIGDKFANRLMTGLSKEKGKSKLGIVQPIIDNFDIPKGFDYYIDSGIMYTTVSFQKKFIGWISPVRIENDKIKFDRIPIQEYLRKVKENRNEK